MGVDGMNYANGLAKLRRESRVRRAVAELIHDAPETQEEKEGAYLRLTRIMKECGADIFVVLKCECGQKNRVDKARAVAFSDTPNCGACKKPLVVAP